jgi:hypothetical protein
MMVENLMMGRDIFPMYSNTIYFRITGFENYVHCPEFQQSRGENVSETESISVFR